MTTSDPAARPAFRVRVAVLGDLTALIALRRSMYEAMFVPDDALADPAWQTAFTDWFVRRLEDPSTRIVVAELLTDEVMGAGAAPSPILGELQRSSGLVAACAIGEVTSLIPGPQFPNGRVGLLSNVSTLAGYRGAGMGAACTDAVLTWFTEAGVERIDLFATEEGEPIYLKRGFERRRFPAMVRSETSRPVS